MPCSKTFIPCFFSLRGCAAICIFSLSSVFYGQVPANGGKPATAPAYESDPRFKAAMADGDKLLASGQLAFAVDAYKKANKIAGGRCFDCLSQAVQVEIRSQEYKSAAKDAAELIANSSGAPERSIAEAQRARVLYMQAGDKPKPDQMQAVHALLEQALTDYPKNLSARFLDATVLARMGNSDDSRKEFLTCVDQCSPTDPYRLRAQHFAENPALSYAKMAPAFTVTALDGSKFQLDSMGGRVVLIDFWATWCGPCNEELPQMKKIAKDFAGQPLVIISISWDSDEKKWKDFIAKNQMTWMQYRDANQDLTKRFGVEAIPHYFTIDSDGVLTSELLGSGNDVEGKLRKLVAKAKAARAEATISSAAPATPTSAK